MVKKEPNVVDAKQEKKEIKGLEKTRSYIDKDLEKLFEKKKAKAQSEATIAKTIKKIEKSNAKKTVQKSDPTKCKPSPNLSPTENQSSTRKVIKIGESKEPKEDRDYNSLREINRDEIDTDKETGMRKIANKHASDSSSIDEI